jgi:tetratricopeptide (TPR) repeat protein
LFLKVCVWDAELRELRAECFIKEGEPRKAISDLKAASKLKNDNTEAFYKISTLYYQLGDHELSLRLVLLTPISDHSFITCKIILSFNIFIKLVKVYD